MRTFLRSLVPFCVALILGASLIGLIFFLLWQIPTPSIKAAPYESSSLAITSTLYLPIVEKPSQTCYYVETNDAVVVEIESVTAVDQWMLENSFTGFGGSGYYVWRGPEYFTTPGIAVLTYPISLTKQATYRLNIHNWHPDNPSEMNDIWVRLDEREWIKGFSNKINKWTWDFNFQQGSLGPADFFNVSPGLHNLQIAARSNGFGIDRFALSANGQGQLVEWPESPCIIP